jgi:ribosomal-protein-alanine N-acetyltransferase
MTEAVAAVVELAFGPLQLHRVEANIIPRNMPSRRVVEKLGFVNEGLSPKYLKINGVWEDHMHYVVLNPDDM